MATLALAAMPVLAQQSSKPAQVQPGSEIGFAIKQMGVPVEGKFGKFTATIALDPKKPETGNVAFAIDTGSARFGSAELDAETPKPVWNPDIPQPIDFFEGWNEVPDENYDNAFKAQWELFLKHVAGEGPFRWNLLEGARGVQLAELGLRSWSERVCPRRGSTRSGCSRTRSGSPGPTSTRTATKRRPSARRCSVSS